MQIYVWELLPVFYHPEKFRNHRHCDSRDMMDFARDLVRSPPSGITQNYEWVSLQDVTTLTETIEILKRKI